MRTAFAPAVMKIRTLAAPPGRIFVPPLREFGFDVDEKVVVRVERFELRKLCLHVFGGVKQEAGMCSTKHCRVVVRVTGGDHPVVEIAQRVHRVSFLIGHPKFVSDNAVIVDDQTVAKERWPAQVLHQRSTKLLERVRQDQYLRAFAKRVEKLQRTLHWRQRRYDGLEVGHFETVLFEQSDPTPHQHVVVGLISSCPAKRCYACLLSDRNPNFRDENPFQVKGDDRLLWGFIRRTLRRTLWRRHRHLPSLVEICEPGEPGETKRPVTRVCRRDRPVLGELRFRAMEQEHTGSPKATHAETRTPTHTENGIVVVGGGFAGFWAAVAARRVAGPRKSIALVSRDSVLQIRPRLYEAAPETLGVDLRELLASVAIDLFLDTANGLNVNDHVLSLASGSTHGYEKVIVAAGSVMPRPPVPGFDSALSIDTQSEAVEFDRLLAAAVAGGANKSSSVSIGIIGGGFTGIELALELRDRVMVHGGIDAAEQARITLIERASAIGPELGEGPRPVIEQALTDARIELILDASVRAIEHGPNSTRIAFAEGTSRDFDLVVLSTGLAAAPFTASVPGARDRAGRVLVDSFLRAPAAADVFVTGDAAAANVGDGHHTMQSCQHALRTGRYAGENAARELLGLELVAYAQTRYVTCLDLGRSGAVLTTGWERTVSLSGNEAKTLKRKINTEVIYPPIGGSAEALLESSKL